MRKVFTQANSANFFGMIAYIAAIWGWVFLMGAAIYLLAETPAADFMPVKEIAPTAVSPAEPSVIPTTVGYGLAAVMAIVTLGILVLIPYFVAKKSGLFLRQIMVFMNIPPSKRTFFFVKCVYSVVPLAVFIILELLPSNGDMIVPSLHAAAIVSAAVAVAFFALQLIQAKRRALSVKELW